jgi:hypothetical protein
MDLCPSSVGRAHRKNRSEPSDLGTWIDRPSDLWKVARGLNPHMKGRESEKSRQGRGIRISDFGTSEIRRFRGQHTRRMAMPFSVGLLILAQYHHLPTDTPLLYILTCLVKFWAVHEAG